jgi:hypothetical protein
MIHRFVRSVLAVSSFLVVLALPLAAGAVNEPDGQNNNHDNDIPAFSLGTATAALTLLSGGLLVLRARKHRKTE